MVLIDDLNHYLYQNTQAPSSLWRTGSHAVLLGVHAVCWTAQHAFNTTESPGLDRFVDLLKARADYKTRNKGLLTVSNHISVLDDPLIWGVLPLSFAFSYGHQAHRWTFASHDLCFTNTILSHFFTLGQTLPTHRIKHSIYGGLFQPTFTEGVRMLSRIDGDGLSYNPHCATIPRYRPVTQTIFSKLNQAADADATPKLSWPRNAIDPLSPLRQQGQQAPAFPSYPNDVRMYNAPSRYASNSYSWVHIFPEGFIHQTEPDQRFMRYFKWGVSRLILEPPEAPDLVPMFIEGTDRIMHESRTFPRFIPRVFNKVSVAFGDVVDVEAAFGDLRKKWRQICDRENENILNHQMQAELAQAKKQGVKFTKQQLVQHKKMLLDSMYEVQLGIVSEKLKWDPEVVALRKECTRRVRDEVLKVRRSRGYADEDPKGGLAETWKIEGPNREGKMDDGSWVKET